MKPLLQSMIEFFKAMIEAKRAADLARTGHWYKAQELLK